MSRFIKLVICTTSVKNLAGALCRLHLEIVFVKLNEELTITKFVGVVPCKTTVHLE